MLSLIRPAIVSTVAFTVLVGIAYPLAVTGAAQLALPAQADGSLVRDKTGAVVGSSLIGQAFASPRYLQGRPSAAGTGYDASASSGSNYGPMNPDLATRIQKDAAAVRVSTGQTVVPADAVTTSGSGLDPQISPAYAALQVDRIAKARGLERSVVLQAIRANTAQPALGFLGQPAVNVLETNLALDARLPRGQSSPR